MLNSFNNTVISSAELTAYWRSAFPQLSGDSLSARLVTAAGVNMAEEFAQVNHYPLIKRHISVRAGYMLQQTTRLLLTQQYDSVISLASGFSLLSYYIALAMYRHASQLRIIDTDLPLMLSARKIRLAKIKTLLNAEAFSKITTHPLDLECAYREKKHFKSLFPNCRTPVFIIEGLLYYLSDSCVTWIFDQIATYDKTAVIFDYWPEDSAVQSDCFARQFSTFNKMITEQLKCFWDNSRMAHLCSLFSTIQDCSIQEIEREISLHVNETPQFTDPDTFFPVHLITALRDL